MLDSVLSLTRPAVLDADAFAELYRAHLVPLLNYCLYCVGDRATAEDLAADTFERAWRARRRYRPDRAAFSTWLFAIGRRVVADWHRRRWRRPQVELDEGQPDQCPGPESAVEGAEQQACLRRLVAALNRTDRELVALKFGAGLTNREIGRLLGKSESAVGSALYRIMERLRAQWRLEP